MITLDFPAPSAQTGDIATSGVYTPTVIAITNLDAVSIPSDAFWLRIGSLVIVYAAVTIDPTASGTTQFDMTLPIASGFSAGSQARGVVATGSGETGRVEAETVNNRFSVIFTATVTTSHTIIVSACYQLV